MKISKLIVRLIEIMITHGDVSVFQGTMKDARLLVYPSGLENITVEDGENCKIVVLR